VETVGPVETAGPSARRHRSRAGRLLPQLGPAFVTAVAYVDPGNFATNVTAGSRYGYMLVWVVAIGNLVAMLIQYLSAKAGAATGRSLAALCRDAYSRPVTLGLWAQAEVVAVATDLAEVVGGAVALRMLFGVPLLAGGLVTGAVAFALLGLRGRGQRPFEAAIVGLLGVVLAGFVVDLLLAGPSPTGVVHGALPRLDGVDSLVLAAGMLGATVMPHAIFLHGGLTSVRRTADPRPRPRALVRAQQVDVVLAMCVAGLMNLLLLVVAAAALPGRGVETLEQAHSGLGRDVGSGAALLFALALLASGLAASSVGTLSGQLVMEGFLRRRVPDAARRLATLLPALGVIAAGVDPTRALVLSQVVLSFGIPFALVPLVHLTARREVMGAFVNRRVTTVLGVACAALVVVLNATLVSVSLRG
jgi:manganese transport protein